MDIPVTQLPPGDPRLVEAIVGQLKSKGIFDQFRKECLADVDTKPAFQNLRLRVEGQVNKFLEKKTWKNDMNKNQLRDGVRKHVNNLGILDTGIDAIITQVVNPKIKPLILPYVEDTVYTFLQIDKPKRERKHSEPVISPVFKEEKEEEEVASRIVKEEEEELEELKIKPVETIEEVKPSLLPMETDVISSEEDDILARESPEASHKSDSSPEDVEVKRMDENAQDGFESCPQSQEVTPDCIVSNVERLHLSEDDSKSTLAAKAPLPLFEDQSLDSISSNSSGLTFSPHTEKGSPESKKSNENGVKSDESPRTDVRSTTSTPLVDEKPVDETSQSSLGSEPSKEFQSSHKSYPARGMQGDQDVSPPSLSALQSSGRSAKDGTSLMSVDEDSLESKESFSRMSMTSEKSEVEAKAKSEKSEGEITSSSEASDGDMKSKQDSMVSEERQHSDHASSHKSSKSKGDYRKRHDSHSRDRDREREKEKDSKHHKDKERKHSKSRDDHHSHRDKDKKHHRRDKDHDGDRERSRSHHHQSSSSHKESSGSSRSSGDKDKDRSSHHSSGKSSEGKNRSTHFSEKSDGKPSNKMETKSDEKSDGKSHKKEESKHDKKHHGTSDKKSDGKREKKSEERTDKKSDKKFEKKENSDGKQDKKSEVKTEEKENKAEDTAEDKEEQANNKSSKRKTGETINKSNKIGNESSSKYKKHDSNHNNDSKKHKRSHRHKDDTELYQNDKHKENQEHFNSEKTNGVCQNLNEDQSEDNGETRLDAHMLGLNGDNIIVADDEGNFMLLTYEDDSDSLSSTSQMLMKCDDSSVVEMQLEPEPEPEPEPEAEPEAEPEEKGSSNDFEGFENTNPDKRLADYLLTVETVPDEMDMEVSEWFDESDLHITLYGDRLDGKIPLNDFLKCVHQLGAVIRNEKGEIEDHCVKGVAPNVTEIKETLTYIGGKKRRLSNSSSISSSSSLTGSPKHKRTRRESSAASDSNQNFVENSVIVSGYALLTPEDDGNRTMSREYDLDYSRKIANYSPLSPASDSSADEGKAKNRGTAVESSDGIIKPPPKIDQKTEASWPNKETKFSV